MLDAPPCPAVVEEIGPGVGAEVRDCALALIRAVLVHHRVPPAGCRVRMTGAGGLGESLLIQVNLRVHGAPARVQTQDGTAATAIAAAGFRLDRQIRQLRSGWQPRAWPDPGRPPLTRPETSRIARVKTERLQIGRPCQAAATLYAMDYDAHLYTDAETGEDAIVYRSGPTGLRIARQHSMRPSSVMPLAMPLTVNSHRVPVRTAEQAAEHLGEGRLPFLFFTDAGTGRGALCYRRYDGAVGLVRPAGVTDR